MSNRLDATKATSAGVPRDPLPWGQAILVSLVSLLVLAAMLNFAPLLPLIREEMGLTNAWVGMMASATILSHTLLQLPGGQIIDRLGPKQAVTLSMAMIGVLTIASALAPNFSALLLCRFLLGVGTAVAFVAGLACIGGTVPPGQRATVQGIFGASGNLGLLLVLLTAHRVAEVVGWRGAFALEGALILATTLLLMGRLRQSPVLSQISSTSWGETLGQRPLYLLGLGHVLSYGIYMALSTWVATFLWERHGVGLEWAGPLAAFLTASGVVARLVGGPLATGRERQVILTGTFATAAIAGLVPHLPHLAATMVALLLLGWFASLPFAAVFSLVAGFSRGGDSAKPIAVANFVANVGALLFPPAVGYALDVTNSYVAGFGLLAASSFAGSLILLAWLPRSGKQ